MRKKPQYCVLYFGLRVSQRIEMRRGTNLRGMYFCENFTAVITDSVLGCKDRERNK